MEDTQATAKWANRVLRPLTSICRRIAKHQETLSVIAIEFKPQETKEDRKCSPLELDQKTQHNCPGSDADPDENDPAWIPGKRSNRRRARHKYSTKAEETGGKKRNRLSIHSPEASRTLPGAIEVATPLITGRRWEMPSSAQSQCHAHANPKTHQSQPQVFRDRYALHKSPWQELLDQSGDPGFADIAHNLDRVFQNFLCNTVVPRRDVNPLSGNIRRGARSLLSMVARSLPEFIAKEQEQQDELDEDGDEDMCDAYFTELESYYSPYGAGWKPLREAARAQGIYLVSSLIQNRWITDAIACALIEKCRSFAPEESDSLLSVVLSTRKTYPYPQALRPATDRDISDPIRLLRKYAHHGAASRAYIFDELANILLRGVLPPEWMGTKLWTSWVTRATISFSREDDDYPAASRLIEAVLLSASGICSISTVQVTTKLPVKRKIAPARATRAAPTTTWEDSSVHRPCPLQVEDALSNHVISLMAALCGMHISRSRASDEFDRADGTKAGHLIRYLYIALQRHMDPSSIAQRPHTTPHELLRRGCILLATSLVQCNDALLSENTQYLMASTDGVDECADAIASRPDMIKELALFMQQAFRCLKGGAEGEPDRTTGEIRDMVSQLVRLADTPGLSAFLGRSAAEAAMIFAEATADPDDHMWAADVQETVVTRQSQQETDQGSLEEGPEGVSQKKGLFRWEDSIGEWVACTPVSKGKPIIAQKAQRPARMLSSPAPCVPCSTDSASSSPWSDRFQDSTSSLTSSPPQMAAKRTFEDIDASSIRPRKRQRPTPVVIVGRDQNSPQRHSPTPTRFNSTVEPVTRRDILRERSTNLARRTAAPSRQANKVEVVIINNKETAPCQRTVRPVLERVTKQAHRTMERRRSTRISVSSMRQRTESSVPRAVIPCSQDGDSDDELSFF
ncbi:hypothetical protein N7457_008889 [Penicillium paradoxum]|uniref:uncharacterized protein n=1 Tax=Penicillium paradoxum TaxID=176176 RepID=UPI0025466F3D|nr:uncharacterized protein N7457_008889 [Penicillium paradoxum]KAJ5773993.1 hypothetical protein N7457_008889 [Penicillium paradoxum]